MHYLVTGGCGFIGSHLIEGLLAAGHTVTVVDDLSTGKRKNLPKTVEVIEGDVTKSATYESMLKEVDGVFHLAAIVSVQRSQEEQEYTHKVNYGATALLMNTLVKMERKIPVVIASSAAVYGSLTQLPQQEASYCIPLSPYGSDKLSCEKYAYSVHQEHALPVACLRFFNVYGPRQDASSPYCGVISVFAKNMRKNQPVLIYGDGEQTRDFVYVKDVASALMKAMGKLSEKAFGYGVFNICTGRSTSINHLALGLADITHSQSVVTRETARNGEVRHSQGDPKLAETMLGFTATTPLREGLEQTLGDDGCD